MLGLVVLKLVCWLCVCCQTSSGSGSTSSNSSVQAGQTLWISMCLHAGQVHPECECEHFLVVLLKMNAGLSVSQSKRHFD
jgi:hypothetical protein